MRWRRARAAAAPTALLLLAATAVPAASTDREQPAEIYADRVRIDQQSQISHYQGNVTFAQGSMRISGDSVKLATAAGALASLDIEGDPARYAETDDAGRELRARAAHIHYDATHGTLRLRGDARLCRGGEYFRSEQIDYETTTGSVEAGRPSAGTDERVHIILRPRGESDSGCDALP